jgi:hypothetical protein
MVRGVAELSFSVSYIRLLQAQTIHIPIAK